MLSRSPILVLRQRAWPAGVRRPALGAAPVTVDEEETHGLSREALPLNALALGHEGESFSRGGYLHRGSDDLDGDSAVVVGSGAGGGTLPHELAEKGVTVVLLEAAPHLTSEDRVDDEREAFHPMTWLDPRTTTASWRIADAGGETLTHWSGATPRFTPHEVRTRSVHGRVEGVDLVAGTRRRAVTRP